MKLEHLEMHGMNEGGEGVRGRSSKGLGDLSLHLQKMPQASPGWSPRAESTGEADKNTSVKSFVLERTVQNWNEIVVSSPL